MVRISKDAAPGDYEEALAMVKEGTMARRGSMAHASMRKVVWLKGAYAVMQGLPKRHDLFERQQVRDFAVAIAQQGKRSQITAEDVKAAYKALFDEEI